MLKTTEQLQATFQKKLNKTTQKILKDFNKMDYIHIDKLINDVLRYNRLLGLTRRTKRVKQQNTFQSFSL